MPAGYSPMKLEMFGGLNTLLDPNNLPTFASPDCQDVQFFPKLVGTRPGLVSQFPQNPSANYNYLKTYITSQIALRMLALDSLGTLFKENPQGTLNQIIFSPGSGAGQATVANSFGNSVSLFGREYLAMGDGKFGVRRPIQLDDFFVDMMTQSGPGSAPTVADENLSYSVVASPGGILPYAASTIAISPNGATQNANVVTITVTAPLPTQLQLGDSVVIAGVTVPGYNVPSPGAVITGLTATTIQYVSSTTGLANSGGGTLQTPLFQVVTTAANQFSVGQLVLISGAGLYNASYNIRSIDNPTTFTISTGNVFGAASGTGTVASAGNIVGGKHQVSVFYEDREGYLTRAAPPSFWVASGNKRAIVSNIPVPPGNTFRPSNIIARILCFTPVNASTFFYQNAGSPLFSGNMIIPDITTSTIAVDFSDGVLLEGTNVDGLFDLVELGDCAGVAQYTDRLAWWGERNKMDNWVNLGFEGGGGGGLGVFPSGWNIDPVNGGGGLVTTNNTASPGYLGAYWQIQGLPATPIVGLITQSANQDYLGDPLISPNVAYSIRALVDSSNAVKGLLHIHLYSASAGINTVGVQFGFGQGVQEVIVPLTAALTTIPKDLVLRVYVDGSPGVIDVFFVHNIEIFPTNQPYNTTIVRMSHAEDPETYDGVDGFLNVAPANGQAVRSCFVIRNNFYIAKERSLWVTQNDGTNEPALWSIQEVSSKVGTLSVRGVGLGDEWAIIAGQDGVYFFDGSAPQKISQEIQPTWDQINWAYGHLVDVKVDTKRKRVYILVPFGTSTVANRMFTLDFTDGFGDPNPTNTVNIAGIGRKWSPWSISGNSMNLILRNDGTQQLFIGNNTNTGKIYGLDLTGTVFSDDGLAINSYWQSGYFQDLGRMDFGYIVANITGSGLCNLILRKGDQGWITNLRGWLLSSLGFHSMERQINLVTERMALRFGTSGMGDNFSCQGLELYVKSSAYAPVRGINA